MASSNPTSSFHGSLHTRLWAFDEESVYDAPEVAGVYALWRYGRVIYYGCATGGESTIRSCLAEHFVGLRGAATRNASHCSWELSARPGRRHLELLQSHWAVYSAWPACNTGVGGLPGPRED